VTALANDERNRLWDRPFGGDRLAPDQVARVLAFPAFKSVDPLCFPEWLKLEDLIANEGRIATYQAGEVVLRKGDYGSSLFLILSGEILGVTDAAADSVVRAQKHSRGSLGRSLLSLLMPRRPPEFRKSKRQTGEKGTANGTGSNTQRITGIRRYDLAKLEEEFSTFRLPSPEMFGELAALTRSPRSAHIIAAQDDTELFELTWQGLREIRKWSEDFRTNIDALYIERGMATRLRECDLFKDMDEQTLDLIAGESLFETYGNFNWTHRFQRETKRSGETRAIMDHEPLICGEGHHLDGLLVVNSGFARVSEGVDTGERTIGYLSRNDHFGLEAILSRRDQLPILKTSLRAIGYVDVIRVPTYLVEKYVAPHLEPGTLELSQRAKKRGEKQSLKQGMMDFLVDRRFINGEQAMVINLDRCVGCDDCVRACAATHDNNPRFVRDGPVYENAMIAGACMHCTDPVCLIGCPTGAIHRIAATGSVIIEDDVCIGCATCANSCPYDNIIMVDIRDEAGRFRTDAEAKTVARATKCDLCSDQITGPACANACPHDALARLNIRDTASLVKLLT